MATIEKAGLRYIPMFFLMIQGKSVVMLSIGVVIGLALHAFMYGPPAFITEQFPARLRYAGSSLAYTLAGVIGGAVAPLIFTALYGAANGGWYLIAGYIALTAVITIVGMRLGRDPQPEADLRLLHTDNAQGSHA